MFEIPTKFKETMHREVLVVMGIHLQSAGQRLRTNEIKVKIPKIGKSYARLLGRKMRRILIQNLRHFCPTFCRKRNALINSISTHQITNFYGTPFSGSRVISPVPTEEQAKWF